jgi:translation elongation factor EF-Ts
MNTRLKNIILICQTLKKHYGFYYEEKAKDKIEQFSKEIIEKKLIEDCEDIHFAKQLCIMNSLKYE